MAINDELNITAITRLAQLNHTNVLLHLNELQKMGIVLQKRFGRIRIYKINDTNHFGYKIKDFFKSWNNDI